MDWEEFFKHIVAPILAALLMFLLRLNRKKKFWEFVRDLAQQMLDDPKNPIQDPQEATKQALIVAQTPEIAKVERAIRSSSPPPFSTAPASQKQEVDQSIVITAKIPKPPPK